MAMSKDEMACVYSALILADDDITITADKMQSLLKSAKVDVQSFWVTLFANALGSCDVKKLITALSSGAAAGPAAAPAAEAAPAAKKEEPKKEEKKKEEKKKEPEPEEGDDDMGFGLFD